MKKILIIGIGAGDPDYVTMQAVNALNRVDVFFLMDKGESKAELIELRKENWQAAMFPVENHGFEEDTSWADEYKRILKLFEENLRDRQRAP